MRQRIDKWKQMMDNNNPMADQYLKDITAEAKSEGKIDEMNEAIACLIKSADAHLDNIENRVSEI